MRTRLSGKCTAYSKRRKHLHITKINSPKKPKTADNSTRITRTSKTNLNDLNDDCIEELLRRLPAVELCKFTILNKRFKAIAEDMFKRLYSCKTITFKPTETCATEFGSQITKYVHLPTPIRKQS